MVYALALFRSFPLLDLELSEQVRHWFFFLVVKNLDFFLFSLVFYIIFGLYAVIPSPHIALDSDYEVVLLVLWKEIILGALYIGGAVIYSTRFPEIKFPGKFNFSVMSSHSIWHLFTIVAALWQLYVCLSIYYYRKANPCHI